jgi:Fe-S-cluster containining protein
MAHEATSAGGDEAHTVTLQIGASNDPLRIALPSGSVPPEAMLPALRTITDAVVARGIITAQTSGRSISCKSGCAACCRHMALISDIEARALTAVVERMPEPRQSVVRARFTAARQRMEQAGLVEPARHVEQLPPDRLRALATAYFKLGLDCPFLEDERCSVYDDRPLVCRKLIVTSPHEWCADPDDDRIRPLRLPMLAAAILLMTSDEEPPQPAAMPLALALDWVETSRVATAPQGADVWMRRFVQRLSECGSQS